jgi:hypothetical protein
MKAKEEDGAQGVGATAFDLPNNQNPRPPAAIHYGNPYVPHPVNREAMQVNGEAIMRQVNEAK